MLEAAALKIISSAKLRYYYIDKFVEEKTNYTRAYLAIKSMGRSTNFSSPQEKGKSVYYNYRGHYGHFWPTQY